MPGAAPPGGAVVRVSVTAGSRRVDLHLPGVAPVAELVPDLARCLGVLDPALAVGGYRLVTHDGRWLAGEVGLGGQGVDDGALLTLTPQADVEAPRVHDDPVEVMLEVLHSDYAPWRRAYGRGVALAAAALLLGGGAVALLGWVSAYAGAAAALGAAGLVAAGVLFSRMSAPAGLVATVLAAAYAGVAGVRFADPGAGWWGWPVAADLIAGPLVASGAAVLGVGLVAAVGLDRSRALTTPVSAVGVLLLVSGAVLGRVAIDPATWFTALLTGVVLVGTCFGWWVLGIVGAVAGAPLLAGPPSGGDDPGDAVGVDAAGVDAAGVARVARLAHQTLLGVLVVVGVTLASLSPFAVQCGAAGTALALACGAAVMVRTRHFRVGAEVWVGLVAGLAGLVSVFVAVLVLHPTWRGAAVAVAGVVGVAAMLVGVSRGPTPVRLSRWLDLAEGAVLVSLLPLLTLASGLVSRVAG